VLGLGETAGLRNGWRLKRLDEAAGAVQHPFQRNDPGETAVIHDQPRG